MAIAKKKATKSKTKVIDVLPTMTSPEDVPYYYVNHLEISNSPFEFALTAGRVPARLTDAQMMNIRETQKLVITPSVQLILPTNVIPELIKALTQQMERHETTYGKSDKK